MCIAHVSKSISSNDVFNLLSTAAILDLGQQQKKKLPKIVRTATN